jgi:hypothetical protein
MEQTQKEIPQNLLKELKELKEQMGTYHKNYLALNNKKQRLNWILPNKPKPEEEQKSIHETPRPKF